MSKLKKISFFCAIFLFAYNVEAILQFFRLEANLYAIIVSAIIFGLVMETIFNLFDRLIDE